MAAGDHPVEVETTDRGEMIGRLGHRDRLLILKKPFAAVEALQLACALCEKWTLSSLRCESLVLTPPAVAERTPELPQTLKFVINELKTAPRTQPLAEYTPAQVFAGTRAGSSFESRTSAMASDLADGWPPSVIRDFRANILKLRSKPDLDQQLYNRMDAVYAKVLPGYNGKIPQSPDSTYFVIGPEKQLDAWEKYLKLSQGEDAMLYRLVARDYWVIVE